MYEVLKRVCDVSFPNMHLEVSADKRPIVA